MYITCLLLSLKWTFSNSGVVPKTTDIGTRSTENNAYTESRRVRQLTYTKFSRKNLTLCSDFSHYVIRNDQKVQK